MTQNVSTGPNGHRRGRYLLSAVIVALTVLGVTVIARGASEQPHQPPLSTAAAAAPSPGTASASTRSGDLTSGPLMSTSAPTRVVIPALDVDVPLIGLGQLADGSMQVPADAKTVGWYTRAPTPGSLGPAVLAGHVDFKKRPGTFARLADLRTGDRVTVDRQDHSVAMFTVTAVRRYAKDAFPSAAVYGPIDHAGLRLITCGGDFDSRTGHYVDNIVVYADLLMAHPA